MSIQTRTIFIDKTGGIARFADWALTTTTLGTMAEPFTPNLRYAVNTEVGQFDAADEIARIDDIRDTSFDTLMLTLSGGVHALNGGVLNPRDGR